MLYEKRNGFGPIEGCTGVRILAERPVVLAATHPESWQDGVALLHHCVAALGPVANKHLRAERGRGHVVGQGLLDFTIHSFADLQQTN